MTVAGHKLGIVPALTFELAEFDRRLEGLRGHMARQSVDCMLIHVPSSIYYFSGFQTVSSNNYSCLVVPLEQAPALVLWHLEEALAARTSWLSEIVPYQTGDNPIEVTANYVQSILRERSRLAVELGATPSLPPRLLQILQSSFSPDSIVDAVPLIDEVRRVKSPAEIDCFHRAASLTDLGMKAIVAAATAGHTDNEAAAAGLHALIAAGSDYPSLPPILSAGEQSAVPHSTFSRLRLRDRDAIVVELGACVARYSAPLMRTIAVGAPAPATEQLHREAIDLLTCVLSELRPGAVAEEIARTAWKKVPKHEDLVFHGVFGYAVGPSFPPGWADGTMRVRLTNRQPIVAGMVLHLAMAFRRPPITGAAVSETVVITDRGPEVLGHTPRRLLIGGEYL